MTDQPPADDTPELAEELIEELIAAWQAWDRHPGTRDLSVRRIDALKAITGDWLALASRIGELRRDGLPTRAAITRALQEEL
jgi:hypothetical protein